MYSFSGFLMDKNVVYQKIKDIFTSDFNLDPETIELETKISEELNLDSLDMVDVILSLNDHLDTKITPSLFKEAKTVQDMVDLLLPYWK